MTKVLYAGSFDPFTKGHLDLVKRASLLFDAVVVGVLTNVEKRCAFTPEERCAMIEQVLRAESIANAEVCVHAGLTVALAKEKGCGCMLRGIRDAQDLGYEAKLEAMNLHISPQVQTIYMAASAPYAHISSSAVKELCAFGASIEGLVPAPIQIRIAERLAKG